MYLTAKAQYKCFIENNKYDALNSVDDAISAYPKNIYPYLTKLDILKKYDDYTGLNNLILEINNLFDRDNEIFRRLMYLKAVIYVRLNNNDKTGALDYYYRNIENKFGQSVNDIVINEINSK